MLLFKLRKSFSYYVPHRFYLVLKRIKCQTNKPKKHCLFCSLLKFLSTRDIVYEKKNRWKHARRGRHGVRVAENCVVSYEFFFLRREERWGFLNTYVLVSEAANHIHAIFNSFGGSSHKEKHIKRKMSLKGVLVMLLVTTCTYGLIK